MLSDLGERREAVAVFRRAIELDPVARATGGTTSGNVLFEFGPLFRGGGKFSPSTGAATQLPCLATAGPGSGFFRTPCRSCAAGAQVSCQAVLAIDAASAAAISLLGELRADHGQFTEAEELFKRAIAIDPVFAFAYFSIATNRKMTREDTAWLQGTKALLAKPLPLRHEISLRYALGKYFDDVKQFDEAFASYRQANELTKRYGSRYHRSGLS